MRSIGKATMGLLLTMGMMVPCFAQVNEQTGGEKDPSGYGAWDSNTDNQLDESEFADLFGDNDYYSQWDSSGDSMLDEDEWRKGLDGTYPDYDYDGTFRDWDSNSDGYLDSNEYVTGSFGMWDSDGNGYIDGDEYDTWKENRDGTRR